MSRKQVWRVEDCVPGMVIAEDIYKGASLLVPRNVTVNDSLIEHLTAFGIETITVYLPRGFKKEKVAPKALPEFHRKFKQSYQENLDKVKTVLHDLAAGRQLEMDKMEDVFDSMYNQVTENYSLIECINEVRHADSYTYTHCLNVALYGGLIARWMGMPEVKIQEVIQAGVLHDIGKAKVPTEILNKKGPLLPEEMELMRKHSAWGYKMVEDNRDLNFEIKETILMHHERENGRGYPFGVTGECLTLSTKIIIVADVYDALTSERVYKQRMTPFDTFKEFEQLGFEHFDPHVMLTFLNHIANYYTGAKVRMNTDEIGEIACILPHSISTPMVVVGGKCLDLSQNLDYKIVEML